MKRTISWSLLSIFLCGSLAMAQTPDKKTSPQQQAAQASNAFAVDLYRQLGAEEGNLFFSPASISTALTMTYGGARTKTADQMAQVLHLKGQDDVHAAFGKLLAVANSKQERPFELRVANRLWGQQGYPFKQDFLALTKQNYGAELDQVDFAGGTEAARDTINGWVEQQTNKKIKNLMPEGSINGMTRLVLTNAIYFLGTWQHTFDKQSTQQQPFFTAKGKVQVPLMYQQTHFGYVDQKSFQVLVLPYKGNQLSMVVLLPKKKDGLAALEKELTADKLALWTKTLRSPEVRVWLPRFKQESAFTLNDALKKLGMSLAFTPGEADFSGIDGQRDLYISAAIHKAFVDVNEQGTEAAAATGISIGLTAAPIEAPPEFRADHPFLYLIRENQTGAILFLGRLADPS